MEIIKVENLSFRYPNHKEALKNVNLSIPEGDFLVISGPNGAGKTTFLKCLNGLLKPQQGKVYFKGQDISQLKPPELFSKIGYSFQDPNDQLFAPFVREDIAFGVRNLGLSKEEINQRVEEVLELLDIKSIAENSIYELSYGLKQRVALAGILVMKPSVLLLDEPTSSLDPETEEELLSFLKKLNQEHGLTIIMSTHDMDLIPEFAKSVAIFAEGMLVRQGNLEEIFGCDECLKKGRLRLPRISLLIKALKEEGLLSYHKLPLSIQEAKEIIREALNKNDHY